MDYGYSNPWGLAAQGGLMSPFVPWGLGATAEPVQPQEATTPQIQQVMGEGRGRVNTVPGNPATATQLSQATKDRVAQSFKNSLGTFAGRTALGLGGALASGMPTNMVTNAAINSIASPTTIGGLLGGGINAALGTTPQGFLSRAISAVPGIGLGMAFGPMGGLLGGMFGGVLADGAMDAMNARKEETLRDDMENKSGYFGGRTGYADLQSYADKANKINAQVAEAVNKAAKVAAIAGVPAPSFSPRSVSTRGMEVGEPGSRSYGGWGNVGGPTGGARAVDRGYGANMGGFAGLGIGNPSSYGGGRGGSDRDRGGFGANDGNSDTAGNAGFGR